MSWRSVGLATWSAVLAALACSAAGSGGDEAAAGAAGGGGASGAGATAGRGGSGGTGISIDGGGGGGAAGYSDPGAKLSEAPACAPSDLDADLDGDGSSPNQGDCNDCSRQIGPGAVDWPGNGLDEDCSGTPDDEPDCDAQAGDVASADPVAAARALGLCRLTTGASWGLVSARYVKADGTAGMAERSHGLLTGFGSLTPRSGASMLALSSGTAREPGQPGYQAPVEASGSPPEGGAAMGTRSAFPPGYPIAAQGCGLPPENSQAFDSAALEVVVKVPTNANAFSFDFNFHSAEYPNWVCDQYNDVFATFLEPAPSGALSGNISFDEHRNPISVNAGLLAVCEPGKNQVGRPYACPSGPSALVGTGYDAGAATGWVNTRAYVPPGATVRVRFTIWDTADSNLDSLVLLDHARFDVGVEDPATTPIQ